MNNNKEVLTDSQIARNRIERLQKEITELEDSLYTLDLIERIKPLFPELDSDAIEDIAHNSEVRKLVKKSSSGGIMKIHETLEVPRELARAYGVPAEIVINSGSTGYKEKVERAPAVICNVYHSESNNPKVVKEISRDLTRKIFKGRRF